MLEKTINGKTYVRTDGNPDYTGAEYFKKQGPFDAYSHIGSATGTLNNNQSSSDELDYSNVGKEQLSLNQPSQVNYNKEDINNLGNKNEVADANRKSYFQDEMGYKGDWAKKADEEMADEKTKRIALNFMKNYFDPELEESEKNLDPSRLARAFQRFKDEEDDGMTSSYDAAERIWEIYNED